MRINKSVTSALVLSSFCGFSIVNNVSANNSQYSATEKLKTDSNISFEKARQYVSEHKGIISNLIVFTILLVVYYYLPKTVKRNIVHFLRKCLDFFKGKRYVTSGFVLRKGEKSPSNESSQESGVVTPGGPEILDPATVAIIEPLKASKNGLLENNILTQYNQS